MDTSSFDLDEFKAHSKADGLAVTEPTAQKLALWAREFGIADTLLTEREVAERQGRSVRTLQNQRGAGGGIPYLKLGRSVRYRLSDVLAWEEAQRRLSTSDRGDDA